MSATATPATPSRLRTAWFFVLLALASLIWSAQGIAVKVLDRNMGPIAITFLPFYITTLLFVPLLITSKSANQGTRRPSARDWVKFAIAGVGGQVLAQLGMTWGISKSLASNGSILNLLIPVISAVLASLMLKERLTLLRVVSLLIGLGGVFLMSVGDWKQASFGQMRFLVGNFLILGGCLGSSFYNVYCKGLMQSFSEIQILIFSYITASLASLPLLIWVEPFSFRTFLSFNWQSWAAFAFLALLMYGASMLLFFKALQHLDVTTASASLYLVPVFGVILAALLLGERLNLVSIAGAAVVLVATLLIMRYDTSY
jgi:drug/metabolite transporter (DMT)-like permease